jgi:Alpha galactosidase C-terminal beta sandwich domain
MSRGLGRMTANRKMLAVDQDPLGLQGYAVSEDEAGRQVWAKTLYGTGRRAVVLLNRGVQPASVTVRWADLGLASVSTVRDVWGNRNLPVAGSSSYSALVRPHGSVMLIVQGTDRQATVLARPAQGTRARSRSARFLVRWTVSRWRIYDSRTRGPYPKR